MSSKHLETARMEYMIARVLYESIGTGEIKEVEKNPAQVEWEYREAKRDYTYQLIEEIRLLNIEATDLTYELANMQREQRGDL